MVTIVCLANSFKGGGRCVAGIDINSGKWIRPIGKEKEGAIGRERLIEGREPQMLDIIELPLGAPADNLGCQPENRVLLDGQWRLKGKMPLQEITKYVDDSGPILHNHCEKVSYSYFNENNRSNWKSLQLIRADGVTFQKKEINDKIKDSCIFWKDTHKYNIRVTCPIEDNYLAGPGNYYLSVSLAGPFKRDDCESDYCWKLITGIIPIE